MYKNQLQELAQRSCFNLPSYVCVREGPDHAPRFKASVNFNGEIFQGPSYCTTLRQAEHSAAEVALNTLSAREPSRHLAARVLDETGVFKNLLQETAHRAGLNLPVYTTVRSGPAHLPVFISSVELVGMSFTGEPAKTKKQAEKNAAMASWSALKQIAKEGCLANQREIEVSEEPEQVVVATFLSNLKPKDEKLSAVQRDQQQMRRKFALIGGAENLSNSSPIPINADCFKYSNPASKPNYFLPPCRPSRILPPKIPLYKQSDTNVKEMPVVGTLHSSNPLATVQVRSQTPVKLRDAPLLLEAHQKDEDEWLGGKDSDTGGKIPAEDLRSLNSNYVSSFCLLNNSHLRRAGPSRPSLPPIGTQVPKLPSIPLPRIRPSGPLHSYGIAPPVSIRSVIPVCAAPPARPRPSPPPPPPPPPPPQKETLGQVSPAEEELVKLSRLRL